MATIHVDGKEYGVNGADSLLEACLSLGLNIPYFCWHPALGSVSACCQYAVKQYQNAGDTRGRPVMSCMAPASNGTFISTDDGEAEQSRESVVEWLMTNRPHGCPVCEEDGNCHLQDMTVMVGHGFRRYRFIKRTHRNQDLGLFISHEMSRCIAYYRCVHYCKDYADGTDLGVCGTHDNVYFGRPEDNMLESEFSGNLVEVCPTGVFTDKAHSERYSYRWDMRFAPNIYQQCSIGCNISPGECYSELRRIGNHYNGMINHYSLCNCGYFGYGYVNPKDRSHQSVQCRGNGFIILNTEQAVQGAADILCQSKEVIDIGSPCANAESDFALRELVSEESFYIGIAHGEQEHLRLALKVLREGGIYTPALREIESYDAVLMPGENITQTGTCVALIVRQAVKGKARGMAAAQEVADWQIMAALSIGQRVKHSLFVVNVDDTRLDDITAQIYRAPAEDQTRLGFAIAHALNNPVPVVDGTEPELQSKIDVIIQALAGAKKPLIISGMNAGSLGVIQAVASVVEALRGRGADVGITMAARSASSIGLSIMGGGSLEEALTELETGRAGVVVVLENDLYRHASAIRVNAMLARTPLVMVVDHQCTVITENAHLVLSAVNFAESSGMVINNEGRAQRFFQVHDPTHYDSKTVMLESWHWLHSLRNTLLGREVGWAQLDHAINAVIAKIPELAGIKDAAPNATFRIHGQKPVHGPHRYSGRTAMRANVSVHEPRQLQNIDTMFTFSMKGNDQPTAHCPQMPFVRAPGQDSPQVWNKFQDEMGGKLHFGDLGVCLFEISENDLNYFISVSARFRPQDGKWRIVPYYHLFDGSELSRRTPVFQSCMLQLYIKLNPTDAAKLDVNAGTCVSFSYDGNTVTLPVEITEGLTAGQVGLPMGTSGIAPVLAGAHPEDLKETQQ